ncbi:unnamed protein product, partial [Choristocarpus tenellus]
MNDWEMPLSKPFHSEHISRVDGGLEIKNKTEQDEANNTPSVSGKQSSPMIHIPVNALRVYSFLATETPKNGVCAGRGGLQTFINLQEKIKVRLVLCSDAGKKQYQPGRKGFKAHGGASAVGEACTGAENQSTCAEGSWRSRFGKEGGQGHDRNLTDEGGGSEELFVGETNLGLEQFRNNCIQKV